MEPSLPQITSPYPQTEPNQAIPLAEEEIALATPDGWHVGKGAVQLVYWPRPHLEIEAEFPFAKPGPALHPNTRLGLPDRGVEIPGWVSECSCSYKTKLRWTSQKHVVNVLGSDDTRVQEIKFHLVNFKEFESRRQSTDASNPNARHLVNHVECLWNDFRVHIHCAPASGQVQRMLSRNGGYGITHLGSLSACNNGARRVAELRPVLDGIGHFLSFAQGAWCMPILLVGVDEHGQKVWEEWSCPKGEPRIGARSWFSSSHGHHLEAVFPGFMDRWANPVWKSALHEVVYWYLNSNYLGRGVDAGLILTQAALERLSYAYLVEDRRALSRKSFKDRCAAEQFRELFNALSIPLTIPLTLEDLLANADNRKWIDAPKALTKMRNDRVHPKPNPSGSFRNAPYEAWNLGLWYLELVVLAICGYSGKYSNRTAKGLRIEQVPWADAEP